jgi:hypothetical protein
MEGELKNAAQPAGGADEHYISIKDACAQFGISRSAVFALIRLHRLQKYRKPFDSRTYLRVEDIDAVRTTMPSQRRALITSPGENVQSHRNHETGYRHA